MLTNNVCGYVHEHHKTITQIKDEKNITKPFPHIDHTHFSVPGSLEWIKDLLH